jgi:predicted O-methyltransferase YrrM
VTSDAGATARERSVASARGPTFAPTPPASIRALAAKAWRRLVFESRKVALGTVAGAAGRRAQARVNAYNDPFFQEVGVAREAAEAQCVAACRKIGRTPSAEDSIHFLAFAALKASGFRPGRILELGTAAGETTHYLAALFPDARLHTVDLPWDDPVFRRYHGKTADERTALVEFRLPNIIPVRINTAFIGTLDLPDFDLIWLDAGHEFPEVAWDHFYCLGKLRPGGWLFSDDLRFPDNRLHRRAEAHHAALVTEYFNARQATKFRYLLKREDARLYFLDRKYVGYLHKAGGNA